MHLTLNTYHILAYRYHLEDCLKCLDAEKCNDVTIREGLCRLDEQLVSYPLLLEPFQHFEIEEITPKHQLRWVNIESNLRNLYFQNAFKEYQLTKAFDFGFYLK